MATEHRINGLLVVETEKVPSPLHKPERPVYFTRIEKVLLEDDTERYACKVCGESGDSVGAIRNHLKQAHPKKETKKKEEEEKPKTKAGRPPTPRPCRVPGCGHVSMGLKAAREHLEDAHPRKRTPAVKSQGGKLVPVKREKKERLEAARPDTTPRSVLDMTVLEIVEIGTRNERLEEENAKLKEENTKLKEENARLQKRADEAEDDLHVIQAAVLRATGRSSGDQG